MRLPPDVPFSVNRAVEGGVNQVVLHGQSYTGNYYARNSRATLRYMFSFIPTLTNSNCAVLDLVNAGHSYTCLPPMILHFLESRFKVAPTATSILMVCSIRGNTPSGLPFSAAELWSRGVYTIENGAAIHAVEKVIRVLTKSNDVQNVSAGQTVTKLRYAD
ncbi:hypothetical protein N7449_001141 [Penicillium cf. viridicatum]|uniref:Uncharacterized protein n=1 Tax=Penicillium cf. viridicatum TaxID=2972119 RepID=A0A9W9N654_9EURO|nr:hypothetical protein N7449_001141 [Penicillium cf. viridicatum]